MAAEQNVLSHSLCILTNLVNVKLNFW